MAGESSWRNLSEMDLLFKRSGRRATVRRRKPPKRSPAAWRSVRAGVLALVLLALVAESTRLESSNAKPPVAARKPAPSLDPSCPVPVRFRSAFAAAAAKTGVPASLLVATAYEESRMDPSARSGAGASGLLQLMPVTARELRLERNDPAANVLAGARYLRQLLKRFGGDVELALAAYNAGPTAVERRGAAPSLATLRYAKNVEARAGLLLSCG
ncbi:MAG: lytic transglycosylase domain-containing protein [Gaiellaceae bacterium]